MCITCWREQYGAPKIFNKNVARLIAAVDSVYKYSITGGCLHAIIDDMNLGDEYVHEIIHYSFCNSDIQRIAEEICLEELKNCTIAERASALALVELKGFSSNAGLKVDESLFERAW